MRNFLGEKRVRRVELAPGVTYVRTADVKDQIELSGNDLTAVSITGAFENFDPSGGGVCAMCSRSLPPHKHHHHHHSHALLALDWSLISVL